ncbi:MAG: fimbrillin family protein [Marinifilaceae bacterium]
MKTATILLKRVRTLFYFSSLFIYALTMVQCADKINITINEGGSGSSDSGSSGGGSSATNKVTFNASTESLVSTKGLSALAKDRNVIVYAYGEGRTVTQTPDAQVNYKTLTAGTLSPTSQDMYLTKGTYNFYSATINSSGAAAPTFTNGVVSSLNNGVDYLWWSLAGKVVNTSPELINITFEHCCAQIVLRIEGGTNLTVNSIATAKIYPPTTSGASWSLATGIIAPVSSAATTQMNMGINSNVAQLIVLPVSQSTAGFGVDLSVNVTLNDGATTQTNTYITSIAAPGGIFEAGHSYLFLGIIKGEEIEFGNAQVIDWIPVDETGNPLYPSQVQS